MGVWSRKRSKIIGINDRLDDVGELHAAEIEEAADNNVSVECLLGIYEQMSFSEEFNALWDRLNLSRVLDALRPSMQFQGTLREVMAACEYIAKRTEARLLFWVNQDRRFSTLVADTNQRVGWLDSHVHIDTQSSLFVLGSDFSEVLGHMTAYQPALARCPYDIDGATHVWPLVLHLSDTEANILGGLRNAIASLPSSQWCPPLALDTNAAGAEPRAASTTPLVPPATEEPIAPTTPLARGAESVGAAHASVSPELAVTPSSEVRGGLHAEWLGHDAQSQRDLEDWTASLPDAVGEEPSAPPPACSEELLGHMRATAYVPVPAAPNENPTALPGTMGVHEEYAAEASVAASPEAGLPTEASGAAMPEASEAAPVIAVGQDAPAPACRGSKRGRGRSAVRGGRAARQPSSQAVSAPSAVSRKAAQVGGQSEKKSSGSRAPKEVGRQHDQGRKVGGPACLSKEERKQRKAARNLKRDRSQASTTKRYRQRGGRMHGGPRKKVKRAKEQHCHGRKRGHTSQQQCHGGKRKRVPAAQVEIKHECKPEVKDEPEDEVGGSQEW